MKLRSILLAAASLVGSTAVSAQGGHAQSHVPDCATRAGIEKARCERHTYMFAKCGSVKGEAHFVCDREFLLANPLDCQSVGERDGAACMAEVNAMKTCEPKAGREFMRCVRDEIKTSPMGH